MHEQAQAFLASPEATRLQRFLWLKTFWASNYVSDWYARNGGQGSWDLGGF
jgi:hypothetical protein